MTLDWPPTMEEHAFPITSLTVAMLSLCRAMQGFYLILSFSVIIANTNNFERRNNLRDFTNTVCASVSCRFIYATCVLETHF